MKENIKELLEKYSRNACTPQELRALEAWYQQLGAGREGSTPDEQTINRIWTKLAHQTLAYDPPRPKPRRMPVFGWISAAAAVALIALTVGILLDNRRSQELSLVSADVAPGSDKAFLILVDGTKIALDEAAEGNIAEQYGLHISKQNDGTVVYSSDSSKKTAGYTSKYNTIETPRGGQYQIVLSDGTTIRLNASSSVTFPVQFSASSRAVRITGEAYFNVATRYLPGFPTDRIPFIVETDQQKIEVLGTQFNVNAYPENGMQRTTLVEGIVKVSRPGSEERVLLTPGERAQIGETIAVSKADIEQDIAWKNGDFIYKNEQLIHILQQVSRWYNVEIDCPKELEKLRFSGMISRKRPLSSIITMLQATGSIRVIRKERRLTITT
ncbi:FecR family protein [Sphingobacterium suaedae]|uniref:FecR family protein n=1 Tax=Sphingobacterium suaedae TaxID=1686402 RepID=A0ABW5KE99_9SPHI